jgi:hypothetical protein
MIFIFLLIEIWQYCTGVVNGIYNLQVLVTKATDQDAFHWWRNAQDAATLLLIPATIYATLSGIHLGLWHLLIRFAIVIAWSWISGNGLMCRVLMKYAWNRWNYNWQPPSKPWWQYFDVSPTVDWVLFGIFGIFAIVVSFT